MQLDTMALIGHSQRGAADAVREQIRAALKDHSGVEFTGAVVRALSGPIVYLWLDPDDHPLYVGSSRNGLVRPFMPSHPAGARSIGAEDRLLVYPMPTAALARWLEASLIRALRPKHNANAGWASGQLADVLGVSRARAQSLEHQLLDSPKG